MSRTAAAEPKAKKAIDYKKAIGQPKGLAELTIFYCEETFSFLEVFGLEDESYFLALVRMYTLGSRRSALRPILTKSHRGLAAYKGAFDPTAVISRVKIPQVSRLLPC